jgi:outer membrane protein TolC
MAPAAVHAQNAPTLPPPAQSGPENSIAQDSVLRTEDISDTRRESLPPTPVLPNQPPLPTTPVQQAPEMALGDVVNQEALQLSDVVASLYRAFPLIEIARLQEVVARGEARSALGAWDTKIEYYSLNQPLGFYETYRNGIGVARQTWYGGYVGAGYRVGRGSFQPWYKERETNEGGELQLAWQQPLLQGRAIDPQRVELFQANLRQQAVGPEVQFQILVASRDAAFAYWDWVEQGNAMLVLRDLLDLALQRDVALRKGFAAGDETLIRIEANNVQLFERQILYNDATMKFRDASYKLALFLRDEQGQPLIPPTEWLPRRFPDIVDVKMDSIDQALNNALGARPELTLINLDIRQTRLDLELARNQLLPQVDFTVQGAQDMGQRASASNDKGQYELEAGIVGGVPIQRNKAFGKEQSLLGKLSQLAQKSEFFETKVFSELNQARNNVGLSYANFKASEELLRSSRKLLQYLELAFKEGDFEFILLLEQESKVAESEIKLLKAEQMYFASLAAMQATLGLDPLDQSYLLIAQ